MIQDVLGRRVSELEPLLATPRPCKYAVAKRITDLLLASVLLVVLFPLFLLIALAVRLSSRGPILYRSDRLGLGGRPITFIKFRSMYCDADRQLEKLMERNEKDGPIFKMRHDPRITPVGRFLRKWSLDELPQLLSVISGEMSMVGPRPPLRREVMMYDERTLQRLSVKPGITCYWQIMGRSDLTFDQWVDLDLQYIEKMSFWLDLWIIIRTPWAVLKGQGAY